MAIGTVSLGSILAALGGGGAASAGGGAAASGISAGSAGGAAAAKGGSALASKIASSKIGAKVAGGISKAKKGRQGIQAIKQAGGQAGRDLAASQQNLLGEGAKARFGAARDAIDFAESKKLIDNQIRSSANKVPGEGMGEVVEQSAEEVAQERKDKLAAMAGMAGKLGDDAGEAGAAADQIGAEQGSRAEQLQAEIDELERQKRGMV